MRDEARHREYTREYMRRRRQTEEGRAAEQRYNRSPEGRAADLIRVRRYRRTDKGHAAMRRQSILRSNESKYWYNMSPKGRASQQRCRDRREEMFLDAAGEIRQCG